MIQLEEEEEETMTLNVNHALCDPQITFGTKQYDLEKQHSLLFVTTKAIHYYYSESLRMCFLTLSHLVPVALFANSYIMCCTVLMVVSILGGLLLLLVHSHVSHDQAMLWWVHNILWSVWEVNVNGDCS